MKGRDDSFWSQFSGYDPRQRNSLNKNHLQSICKQCKDMIKICKDDLKLKMFEDVWSTFCLQSTSVDLAADVQIWKALTACFLEEQFPPFRFFSCNGVQGSLFQITCWVTLSYHVVMLLYHAMSRLQRNLLCPLHWGYALWLSLRCYLPLGLFALRQFPLHSLPSVADVGGHAGSCFRRDGQSSGNMFSEPRRYRTPS